MSRITPSTLLTNIFVRYRIARGTAAGLLICILVVLVEYYDLDPTLSSASSRIPFDDRCLVLEPMGGNKPTLVIFDLVGTLTKKDTFVPICWDLFSKILS